MDPLVIDGSEGEGGGQVVRTSLALAAITGRPVRIENVRAGRKKPGLLRQHLTGLRAMAEITGAEVGGAELGSRTVTFRPGPVKAGDYRFSVGSAGSANLVLQTVLPPLMLADGPSTVVLEGGTHNMKSPPHGFLERAFLPLLAKFGPRVELALERHGFYPAGGGRMTARITPVAALRTGFDLTERSDPPALSATAVVSNLPAKIGERELKVVRRRLKLSHEQTRVESVPGPGPGNVVWIEADAGAVTEVFTGFGKKGVTAEDVALGACREAQRWLEGGAPVGEHLADQLLIPMALAGSGRFTTLAPSLHTVTNMSVIERFLPVQFRSEQAGGRWTLAVEPR